MLARPAIAEAVYWQHMALRQGALPGCLGVQQKHGWERWNQSVPQLLLLGGLEGAGHHAAQTLLQHTARGSKDTTVVNLWQGFTEGSTARVVTPSQLWRDICATHHLGCNTPRRGTRVFNVGGSHPFHQPRSASRFIDLMAVAPLDRTLHRVDARFLFLVRDPLDTVVADSVHRDFASAEVQSRVLELAMLYLQHAWDALPCGNTLLMPYEFLTEHPTYASAMIGKLLDADHRMQVRLQRAAAAKIQLRRNVSAGRAAAQLPSAVVQFWNDRVAWRWAPAIVGTA